MRYKGFFFKKLCNGCTKDTKQESVKQAAWLGGGACGRAWSAVKHAPPVLPLVLWRLLALADCSHPPHGVRVARCAEVVVQKDTVTVGLVYRTVTETCALIVAAFNMQVVAGRCIYVQIRQQ